MEATIKQIIRNNKQAIMDAWMEKMAEVVPCSVAQTTSNRTAEANNEAFITLIFDHFANKEHTEDLNEFITRILQFGYPLSYLTKGLQELRKVIVDVTKEETDDTNLLLKLYEDTDQYLDPMYTKLIEDATKSWENTVAIQKSALMELSAPLIPVLDNISVMPLIGAIDTERAKLIMENLLNGVIEHRSQVVLIDITGVPVVDTMVAHHIIQAAEAVRLIGAKCILVGIRPEIAQTIVNLGIELGEFPTQSSLQKGIQTALAMTKREIVETSQEDNR